MDKILRSFIVMLVAMVAFTAGASTYYGFKIGGVSVTSDNYNNVTGSNIKTGTVKYNPTTNTVTLTGVSIERSGSDNRAIYNESNSGLTVRLEGNNLLKAINAAPVRLERSTKIVVASGRTRIWGYDEGAIYISGAYSLAVYGPGKLEISTVDKGAIEGSSHNNTVVFNDINATIKGGGGGLLDLYGVTFNANCHVTLQATGSDNQSVKNVSNMVFNDMVVAQTPNNARFSSSRKTMVYYNYSTSTEGSIVTGTNILISDSAVAVVNDSRYFPDNNFRKHILSLYPKNFISTSEAAAFTSLAVNSKNISSLAGIEYLTGLTMINCNTNQLTSINLTKNTALKALNVSNNQLTTLNLSTNTLLEELYCSQNQLTQLSLNYNQQLQKLFCNDNQILGLNLQSCPYLTTLVCYHNRINISNAVTLVQTLPYRSSRSEIQFQMGADDQNMMNIAQVQTARSKNWFPMYNVGSGGATWKGYNGVIPITSTYFPDAAFRSYVGSNTDSNSDTYIDQYELPGITTLEPANLGISNLKGIEHFTELTVLLCGNNSLPSIDVSKNTKLQVLYCQNNPIGSLDVSHNTALETLDCSNMMLTSLNVSMCPNLLNLFCTSNNIQDLDLSANTLLRRVSCYRNGIAGEKVNQMIVKLPQRDGTASLEYNLESSAETNDRLTVKQAGLIKEKGWVAKYKPSGTGTTWTEIPDYVATNRTNFPDNRFLNLVITFDDGWENGTRDGKLYYTTEIKPVTQLWATQMQISDLTGLEYFTEITRLKCYGNLLTELDVSSNTLLRSIECENNNINSAALDRLIASLPETNQDGMVYFKNGSEDQNVMPTYQQAQAAAEKGWVLKYYDNGWKDVSTTPPVPGDINGDGKVDVTDLNLMVNIVLGVEVDQYPLTISNADINGDGKVDVTDLNLAVNIILTH